MKRWELLPGAVDCHTHLSDPRIAPEVAGMLGRAREAGIANFALAGVGPEDWARQVDFSRGESGVIPCFGIHPYFVAANTRTVCDEALRELAERLGGSLGLGECGLDFRAEIVGESEEGREQQLDLFRLQLRLARRGHKVPVLHIVRAHPEARRVLDEEYAGAERAALVHAFHSGAREAETYLERGFYLSVGGPLLRPNNAALREAVRAIPWDQLLIESDTPDQAPPSYKGRANEPASILLVAECVAELKNSSRGEVLERTRANFLRLFHEEVWDARERNSPVESG